MPTNGEIIRLGTLKVNGTLYAIPYNPTTNGDCVSYNGTAISIENTVAGKELRWRYVKHEGKDLLICDRCLVVNCMWVNLNAAGLIFGKTIAIDGQEYKVRSMTGGVSDTDENNEWSKIIEANAYGIGNGNEIWNWRMMYTWCQEEATNYSGRRTLRGSASADSWSCNISNTKYNENCGWRPVLEILNTAPLISGYDGNLGTKSTDFTQTYTVTDADTGDTVTVVEALDGVRLRSYMATLGAQNTFSVSGLVFQKLLNGNHTMTVTATDKSGAAATRRWTFTKAVNALSITLTAPLAADGMVTKCIVSVTREIPVGASFKVEVCNNGNDTAPTWEDCTSAVNANRKFFFTNTTKTAAKWGLNVRVSIARNNATGDCFVTSIGGNFE